MEGSQAVQSEAKAPKQDKAVTFRVRGVPSTVGLKGLAKFLCSVFDDLGDEQNILGKSLAPSPDDWSGDQLQTGTFEFKQIPEYLQDAKNLPLDRPTPDDEGIVIIDNDFIGFTALNKARRVTGNVQVECIAISGLASHPFGSWRRKGSHVPQWMWLRDALPKDLPRLRVMIYGYESGLEDSRSFQNVDSLAQYFVRQLRTIGMAENTNKRYIFLAHSLGGLIMKRALYYMSNSSGIEQSMLKKVLMIMFFGVPHRGMRMEHLASMVQGQPNQALVAELSPNSSYLNILHDCFMGIAQLKHIRLISAFETEESPTVVRDKNGNWVRGGKLEQLVQMASATCCSSNPADIFQINRNHSEIVKFPPGDSSYNNVRQFIREVMPYPAQGGESDSPVLEPPSTLDPGQQLGSNDLPSHTDVEFLRKPKLSEQKFQQKLLGSLDSKELNYRLEEIPPPTKATFDWIFNKQELGFIDWVTNGDRLYWIRGKPASGKSTLMRYLHYNKFLQNSFRSVQSQVDLWFFFHDRGTFLQKSHEGLLRTILLQLIRRDKRFVQILYRWQEKKKTQEWEDLSSDDLMAMFGEITAQKTHDIDLVLFLDALDEYHGLPEKIASWMLDLVRVRETEGPRTRIKICFSSRPWDAFLAKFADERGFSLHDYTFEDIELYARSCLATAASKTSSQRLSSEGLWHGLRINEVAHKLATKAEGVFVWTKYAIDDLNHANPPSSIAELEALVDKLPKKLEQFYTRSLRRIPEHKLRRALTLLQILLRGDTLGGVTIVDLYEAAACAPGTTFQHCKSLLQHVSNHQRSAQIMSQDLENSCGGLIEYNKGVKRVQFIHQTVKEFVARPGFAELVLESSGEIQAENGFTYLFKYFVVCLNLLTSVVGPHKSPVISGTGLSTKENWMNYVLESARLSESSTGQASTTFLDSIPASFFDTSRQSKDQITLGQCTSSFMFGILANLRLYVGLTIRNGNVEELRKQRPLNRIAWLILGGHDTAAHPGFAGIVLDLVSNGFTPGDEYQGLTAFETIFNFNPGNRMTRRNVTSDAERIIQIFIQHGKQDPNKRLRTRNWTIKDDGTVLSLGRIREGQCPLHISTGSVTQTLLDHGANVNVRNAAGETPLDVTVDVIGSQRHSTDHLDYYKMQPRYEKAITLINRDGRLTNRGAANLAEFLDFAKRDGVNVPSSWYRIPILEEAPPLHDPKRPIVKLDDTPNNDETGSQLSKSSRRLRWLRPYRDKKV